MKDLIKLVEHILLTDNAKLMKYNHASYIESLSLSDIANIINELDSYKVPILIGNETDKDYISEYNAGYLLDYIGLEEGIRQTFESIK